MGTRILLKTLVSMHAADVSGAATKADEQGAHMQAEDGGGGRLGRVELAAVDGVDDCARVAQLDP